MKAAKHCYKTQKQLLYYLFTRMGASDSQPVATPPPPPPSKLRVYISKNVLKGILASRPK
jgi:hypothetical protein